MNFFNGGTHIRRVLNYIQHRGVMNSEKRNILVVVAHPDDEILGCGGTMSRHACEGDDVHILILAEGATSRDRHRNAGLRGDDIESLREAARKAAETLGTALPMFRDFPDNRMDRVELIEVIKEVEGVVFELCPDVIYTHHAFDLNIDHRITHQAVLTACRPEPGKKDTAIYAFETISSTEWSGQSGNRSFSPNYFINISEHLDNKIKALKSYGMELRPFPHLRSVEAVQHLARYRGASVGIHAAEAFELIRGIWS